MSIFELGMLIIKVSNVFLVHSSAIQAARMDYNDTILS